MFKKKKQGEAQQQTTVVVPSVPDDQEVPLPETPETIEEEHVNPLAIQPMQQPVQPVQQQQQVPVQPVQQVQQPVQQPQPMAYIKQAQVSEPGIFHYVIETNYPLGIGICQLSQ